MPSALSLSLPDLETAWERVRENDGCAGVDGVTIEAFAPRAGKLLPALLNDLLTSAYRCLPLLQILIQKMPGSKETRRLLVPSVRDRIAQSAVSARLSRSYEEEFLDISFAYRPGRSVDQAIARVLQWRDRGYSFVAEADIQSFFDSVPHSLLLRELIRTEPSREFDAFVQDAIQAPAWDGQNLRSSRKGIPQGSPLSPVLANLFLSPFDTEVAAMDCRLVRYADDFVILTRSRESADAALSATRAWLAERGLSLKPAKTGIRTFAEGFHFLGIFFHAGQALRPWKPLDRRGALVAMAKPMPPRLLAPFLQTAEPSAGSLKQAFRKFELRPNTPAVQEVQPVAFLYVTEQGSIVRKSGDRILVECDGQVRLDVPYHKLEAVLIFGGVSVTSQAIGELLEKNITVSFFSRGGRYRGAASAPLGNDIQLRLAQFSVAQDPAACLAVARALVHAKLENAAAVLKRYASRSSARPLPAAIARLQSAASSAQLAESLDAIRGIEGSSARAYFEAVMRFNSSPHLWPGRIMHPSTDPINALLSLTYTLLSQELAALLEGLGADPYLGLYHLPDFGRKSLALDLVEPFRHPVADRFVLTLLNRGVFAAEDFYAAPNKAGLYLKQESLRRFLDSYERWIIHAPPPPRLPFRDELRKQAQGFISFLRQRKPVAPFLWQSPASPDSVIA